MYCACASTTTEWYCSSTRARADHKAVSLGTPMSKIKRPMLPSMTWTCSVCAADMAAFRVADLARGEAAKLEAPDLEAKMAEA
mmetsp:Transcript_12878/g.29446  ORF Transcript_12878/g.29446 Transcript_12878/m.29446 type:complete len:83 (+) Transcript_12878:930-1178(+)